MVCILVHLQKYEIKESTSVIYEKKVSMIRKYHNHSLQTNPRHRQNKSGRTNGLSGKRH